MAQPPPKAKNVEELRKAAASCHGCDLYRDATQTVFGEGAERSRLMLIGEQPGDQEDLQGRPFAGQRGACSRRPSTRPGSTGDAAT